MVESMCYCQNCGSSISRNSVFCTWCGAAVATANTGVTPATEPNVQPSPVPMPPPVMPSAYAQPTYASYPPPIVNTAPVGHSGVGIASFVIACVAFITSMITTMSCAANLDADLDVNSIPEIIGLLFMFCIGLMLIGVSLGIIGVVQSKRKKLFAILGLIFNSIMVLPIIVLIILGLLVT
jgi:hypothetical protein